MSEDQKSNIVIYAAGGTGINIGRQINSGFVECQTYFIDTSESNLRKPGIERAQVFLYEGVDGSGKIRTENHEIIAKNMLKILQQFKPGKFNIIVCSAAGGSGSVIGHGLMAELRKRGEQAVIVLVGSTASHIEIENTVKTLQSLEKLSHKISAPVVMHYLENSQEHSRQHIDTAALGAITMLLMLFAGVHDELDTADLRTWLNHKSLGSEVVSLQFAYNRDQYATANDVLSVATIAKPGMNTIVDPVPAYQTVGYAPASWTEGANQLFKDEPVHYLLASEFVEKIFKHLSFRLKEVDSLLASRVKRDSMVKGNEQATDDGLIL